MDGWGDDENDDEAAAPLPPHITVNDNNNGTADHGGMVHNMDVRGFDMNNGSLILNVLKVI